MRIIPRPTLLRFIDSLSGRHDHRAVKEAVEIWYHIASKARWRNAAEIKQTFATASIVNAERDVFNIKGNDYRLIVAIDYERSIVWIKWIGSHRDYDKVDAAKVQHD